MVLNVKISFYNKEFTKRNGIKVLIDDLEFFVPTNAFNLARLSNGKLMEKKINKYNKAPQHNKESAKREAIRTCADFFFGSGSFNRLYAKYKDFDVIDHILTAALDQLTIEIERTVE